jgi:AraC-like DNA-binding protein
VNANFKGPGWGLLELSPSAMSYFSAPTMRALVRRRFVCSSPGHGVYGLIAWGDLDLDDTRDLLEVLDTAGRFPQVRRQLVILRDVRWVSAPSMLTFMRTFERDNAYFATLSKEAVVRPDGIVGLMAEGFYAMVPRRYEGRVFRSLNDAVDWLGVEAVTVAPWLDAVLDLVAEQKLGEQRLGELRVRLIELGATANIDECARALGLSRRSLQRLVSSAGTTFARERSRALIGRAREILLEEEVDVKAIAARLGYRSAPRFVEAFRAETGSPPGEWRKAMRSG